MNLHGLVAGVIGAVNPRIWVSVQSSTGSTFGSSANAYTPQPTYAAPVTVLAQIQPIQWKDLQQLDGLNLQGTPIAMYLFGEILAIVRATGRGGDLITVPSGPYVGVYLVVQVLEDWAASGWCKVACTLQNGS